MDFIEHLRRQGAFSERTFGPGQRTDGVVAHIRKELREIEAKPRDLKEWIDVILLACDGARRCGVSDARPEGHPPEAIAAALAAKLAENERREWPDWRTADPNGPIEHVRDRPDDIVLIWSGQYRMWWRPGGLGYTADPRQAGRWPRWQAEVDTRLLGPEKAIKLQTVAEALEANAHRAGRAA